MKKSIIIVLIILFSTPTIQAQKFELGKVSIKELEQKAHPLDTSANAAVLYNKCKVSFVYTEKNGFSITRQFDIRIKIYKKEGLSFANYEIPYYVGYKDLNQESINISDAVTYNIVEGKIEKTKLNGQGTFKEKVNENWKTVTIALPNVKVGSVIEFSYTVKSENILTFPTFDFQNEIPMDYVEYKTEIPAYFIYKPILKGNVDVKTESEIGFSNQNYTNKYNITESVSYKQVVNTHTAKNVPALKMEDYVDNIDNYRASINYELEVIRKPDQPDQNLAKTWEDVAKTIYKEKDFGPQLKERNYFEGDLNQVTQGLETKEEKMNAIFNFLKVKIAWNGKYGIFTDKGVKKAYEERTGNIAEINFILASMLNSIGVWTNPVLLSTVKNGIATFPNQTAFNYVIVAAEINDKIVLLDASNKYTQPNILPTNTLNWTGRLIRDDGNSEEINLVPNFTSKKNINLVAAIDKNGKISGKIKVQKTDYEAFTFREKYSGMNRDKYIEDLENQLTGIEIKNYTLENDTNTKSIQEAFDFMSNTAVDIIGDKIYINPLLFFTITRNPFFQEDRIMPVYLGCPKQVRYVFNIEIPEGYIVESIPKTMSVSTEENICNFKYNIQSAGNKIQIVITSEINKMLVSANFYPTLKSYFQRMIDKQNEKIIIKKM